MLAMVRASIACDAWLMRPLSLVLLTPDAILRIKDGGELMNFIKYMPLKHVDCTELMRVAFGGVGSLGHRKVDALRDRALALDKEGKLT